MGPVSQEHPVCVQCFGDISQSVAREGSQLCSSCEGGALLNMAAEDIDCSDFFDGPGKRKRSPAAAVATVMQLLKGDSMNMGKEPVSLFRPDDNVGNVLKQEYMPEEQMLVSSIRQELHMPEPPVPDYVDRYQRGRIA